jgi:plastocyanin
MPRRSRRPSASSGLAVLAAALVALLCSLDPGAAARARAAARHTVVIEAVSFQPAVLTVSAGDSVVWVNKDPFPHTATSSAFDSKDIAAGASWTYTARTRGEFPYVCTLHPTMKAILRVK